MHHKPPFFVYGLIGEEAHSKVMATWWAY